MEKKQSFLYQVFTGFTLIFWAIIAVFLYFGVTMPKEDGGHLCLYVVGVLFLVILAATYTHNERRALRGLPRFKWFWQR